MNEAFDRVERFIGTDGLSRLQKARITIFGLGAVGSAVLEALARSGVGHFRLVDFDTIHPSNINRQIFAFSSSVGQKKIDAAARRVREINPAAVVETLDEPFYGPRADDLLSGSPDYVVDAIDSLTAKTMLIRESLSRNIPIISSMGAANRKDTSAIRCTDLFLSHGCPLASKVRKRLRRMGINNGVLAVWSAEIPPAIAQSPISVEEEDQGQPPARPVLPSLMPIPVIFGMMMANRIIWDLLEKTAT